MYKRIGILGYGNMGSAIGQGICQEWEVFVFDKDNHRIKSACGVKLAKDLADLIKNSQVLILAVKPQDFETILKSLKALKKDLLIVSIAAGITTFYLEKHLGKVRVIRVMPNLAIRIGRGMSCLSKGAYAQNGDLGFTQKLFLALGEVLIVEEKLMDAATAVSGSGPGFFFSLIQNKASGDREKFTQGVFIPGLRAAALDVGFDKSQAQLLASATTAGSLAMLAESGLSAQELCSQVASKGGTTAAGLEKLQGRAENLSEAVRAAKRRSGELSQMRMQFTER